MDTDRQQRILMQLKQLKKMKKGKNMMVTLGRSQAKIIEDAHGDFPGGISADQFGENVLNQW